MKRKCYSYLEIEINGEFVGFSTIAYHYNAVGFPRDIISAELLLYPKVYNITSIQIADQWATYTEDIVSFATANQDERLTKQLLAQAIPNLDNYQVSFNRRRDAFYLDLNINQTIHRCLLIHERYISPNFKQVQILATGTIFRFAIDKPDNEIQDEIVSHLMTI